MTPVVRFAPRVNLNGLRPAGVRILAAIDAAAVTCGLSLTVTSAVDGQRAATDPHITGEAIDLRTIDLSEQDTLRIYWALRVKLGDAFTVLYEVPQSVPSLTLRQIEYVNPKATGPHFHIQRKKGTTFPPYDEAPHV